MTINAMTKLVGILANPINHVRTPQIFNSAVSDRGLNVVCVPLHVLGDALETFLLGVEYVQNMLGLIVTMPYKESVVSLCGELTDSAVLVQSVNAMRYDRCGKQWVGANFDGEGFIAGLNQRGHTLKGKRVLLIGAGGAGKSIAYSVGRESPAQLVVHNRAQARAYDLVERLNHLLPNVLIQTGPADGKGFDVIINATSLGLNDLDALPLPIETISPTSLVCEAVMRDVETPLLGLATKRGCNVHHGHHMLHGQISQMADFFCSDIKANLIDQTFGLPV